MSEAEGVPDSSYASASVSSTSASVSSSYSLSSSATSTDGLREHVVIPQSFLRNRFQSSSNNSNSNDASSSHSQSSPLAEEKKRAGDDSASRVNGANERKQSPAAQGPAVPPPPPPPGAGAAQPQQQQSWSQWFSARRPAWLAIHPTYRGPLMIVWSLVFFHILFTDPINRHSEFYDDEYHYRHPDYNRNPHHTPQQYRQHHQSESPGMNPAASHPAYTAPPSDQPFHDATTQPPTQESSQERYRNPYDDSSKPSATTYSPSSSSSHTSQSQSQNSHRERRSGSGVAEWNFFFNPLWFIVVNIALNLFIRAFRPTQQQPGAANNAAGHGHAH